MTAQPRLHPLDFHSSSLRASSCRLEAKRRRPFWRWWTCDAPLPPLFLQHFPSCGAGSRIISPPTCSLFFVFFLKVASWIHRIPVSVSVRCDLFTHWIIYCIYSCTGAAAPPNPGSSSSAWQHAGFKFQTGVITDLHPLSSSSSSLLLSPLLPAESPFRSHFHRVK